MDLAKVDVVLVRPARAANVAASCRAMKNMGLTTLWLVDPPKGLGEREVRALAYGAWDVLDAGRVAGSLSEAVAASTLVVATSGRAGAPAVGPREFAREAARRARGGRLSLVFGPEASGLSGRELALCHGVVHVPTALEQPSLNLAQAVLLLAYELRLAALGPELETPGEPPATAGDLEQAVSHLGRSLVSIGYLDARNPDRILTELRRFLARAAPTRREVVLLRGIARQVLWAGRVAREGSGSDNPTRQE